MQGADTLSLLAEIAAVLVGFVGLTTAYQSNYRGKYLVNLQIGQRYLLMTSGLVLFGALLPLVLDHMGVDEPLLWQISAVTYATIIALMRYDSYRITSKLSEEQLKGMPALRFTLLVTLIQVMLALMALTLPAMLPLHGVYILILFLGMLTTISIFAANVMPKRDRLLRDAKQPEE